MRKKTLFMQYPQCELRTSGSNRHPSVLRPRKVYIGKRNKTHHFAQSMYTNERPRKQISKQSEQNILPAFVLLVTSDQAVGERMVRTITERTPHLVIWTERIREALEIVDNVLPQIILLDELWFSMCGGTWYRRLRASKGMDQVSIVALNKQQEVGTDLLSLKKPITQEHLLATLSALL